MSIASDGNLLARIVLTVGTVGYGLLPIIGDINGTHAANPLWTPHARFHVVWQVASYVGIGLLALALTWIAGPMPTERLYLAAALGLAVYAGFFVATFTRRLFGGGFYDVNGYLPFKAPIGNGRWDQNVTGFGILAVVLLVGVAFIHRPA